MTHTETLNKSNIKKILPHRKRALLLDSAELLRDEQDNILSAVGFRKVTKSDCEGHFPENAILRAVDREEIFALTLGLAAHTQIPHGYMLFLRSIGKAQFPHSAVAGDTVQAKVENYSVEHKRNLLKVTGSGTLFVEELQVAKIQDMVLVGAELPRASKIAAVLKWLEKFISQS